MATSRQNDPYDQEQDAPKEISFSPAFSTFIGRREATGLPTTPKTIDWWQRYQRRNAEASALQPLLGHWSDETILEELRKIDKKWALPE